MVFHFIRGVHCVQVFQFFFLVSNFFLSVVSLIKTKQKSLLFIATHFYGFFFLLSLLSYTI